MIVEVHWRIEGSTTLRDVKDQERAREIVSTMLREFDLPNFEDHHTVFNEPEVTDVTTTPSKVSH